MASAQMLLNLGSFELDHANYDQALERTREALRIQIEIGDEPNRALSLNNIGLIYDLQGEYSESLTYYQQALEIRERLGNPYEIADTLHNLAETYSFLGNYTKAQDHYLRALEQRRQATDEIGAAYESFSLGRVYGYQGRFAAGLAAIDEALEIFRRLEETGSWSVEALGGRGNALSLLGRFDEAETVLAQALEAARGLEDRLLESQILRFQADRLLYAGDFTAADERYGSAVEVGEASGDPHLVLTARAGQARARLMAGHAPTANILEGLVREAQSRGARYLTTRCTICLSTARLQSGDPARAEEGLRRALREAEEMGAAPLVAQSHHLLAAALQAQGNAEDAQRHRAKATEILETIRAEAGDGPLTRSDLAPIAAAGDS